ncbi:MAG: DUF2156 domain-containing protein [Treponema sp.]|uniref:DUF2156 domain-containing protein n=1 Tax=Treponema sp. TaxID=166 RepID=UPI0025E7D31D|nr:phosphatidylglycerol lysyltransferase domain-containing protein [Treponema sp.]MBR0497227.1 DUF2156 domain-containing protein [Treponema sp.]
MNWHTLSLPELEILQKSAVNNGFFANNYGAVNSFLYEEKFHSQIDFKDGWVLERYESAGKYCFSFPHNIEGDSSKLSDMIAVLSDEAKSLNSPLIFHNVTLEEKEILCGIFPDVKFTPTPESGDYIYLTEKLANLTGKKYSRKRNHIHQFESKYPDFSFEPLTLQNLDAAKEVEEKWFAENSEFASENGTLSDLEFEKKIIFSVLENFDFFSKTCGASGGLLFIEGQPVAFCFASLLSQKITDIHFEKCISPYARDGGYAVINKEFAKTVQTEFINREEDLGIEGLRKAKLSYYPEMVLEKFCFGI